MTSIAHSTQTIVIVLPYSFPQSDDQCSFFASCRIGMGADRVTAYST